MSRNKKIIENPERQGISISVESDVHMHLIKIKIDKCQIQKHEGKLAITAKNQGGEAVCNFQINIKRNLIFPFEKCSSHYIYIYLFKYLADNNPKKLESKYFSFGFFIPLFLIYKPYVLKINLIGRT